MLVLTVIFTVAAADADTVADIFRGSLEATRKEPGCIALDVIRANDDPGTFILHEKWRDQAALDTHRETEDFKRVGGILRPLMKSRTAYAGSLLL